MCPRMPGRRCTYKMESCSGLLSTTQANWMVSWGVIELNICLITKDTSAMKVASHELKGIRYLLQTNTRGISTALTCVVDYKGFRLVAIAIFPADGEVIYFMQYLYSLNYRGQWYMELCHLWSESTTRLNAPWKPQALTWTSRIVSFRPETILK